MPWLFSGGMGTCQPEHAVHAGSQHAGRQRTEQRNRRPIGSPCAFSNNSRRAHDRQRIQAERDVALSAKIVEAAPRHEGGGERGQQFCCAWKSV